jgi:hypothetical protein
LKSRSGACLADELQGIAFVRRAEKSGEKQKRTEKNREGQRIISATQRFALAAGGRDEIRFESRKNPKPEKCSKMAQNPTSRLHALLGNLLAYQNAGF